MKPRFFRDRAEFRRWLERNHDRAAEQWVGFYKVGTGKPSHPAPQPSGSFVVCRALAENGG